MSRPLFSTSWHRVAELRPRLRSHVRVHRHRYRGRPWFVLEDLSTGAMHRFRPAAYELVGLMDGQRRVNEVWQLACERLEEEAPTQEDVIRLLGQLHAADLLQSDVPPDAAELLRRGDKQRRRSFASRAMNPLAIQIPLFDPDAFLERTQHWVRPFVGRAGLALWVAVVAPALVLAVLHADELSAGGLDALLSAQNLLLIWLLFPVLKALHELGHAYLAKILGGEVHEIGVMLLVGSPVPFVDASSSSALASRWQRAAVGAGGMLIELFVAALAVFLWVAAEPGIVRTLAFNAIVISGVTTLAFNINPLLRFDGYYILSDLLEIPNLRQRSSRLLLQWIERRLLGNPETPTLETTPGEKGWLVGYALASQAYRVVVMISIAWIVLDWSLVLGIVLMTIAGLGWFGIPIAKGLHFVATNPRLRRVRGRAVTVTACTVGILVVAIVLVPVPLRTRAEAVVWLPNEAQVRAGTAGFVKAALRQPGVRVEVGEALFELQDPELETEIQALEARENRLRRRYRSLRVDNQVEAAVARDDLELARRELARARERQSELLVRAAASGTLVCPNVDDLPGRFVDQGETLARVVDLGMLTIRGVVSQDAIDLISGRLRSVDVRLAERVAEVRSASLRRVVPGASDRLPSSALGSGGGGSVPVESREGDERAVVPVFELELELPSGSGLVNAGGRVYLRFDHGSEPLAFQLARGLRQLFLSKLDV